MAFLSAIISLFFLAKIRRKPSLATSAPPTAWHEHNLGDYFDSIFSRIIVKMLQIPSHGQKVVNSIVEAVKIDKQNKIFVQLLWGQNSLTARPAR